MKEYRRDYIGSADAYDIYRGGDEALIKSKLRDSDCMSEKMHRGVMLEGEVLDFLEEVWEVSIERQVTICASALGFKFCHATLDGRIAGGCIPIEVKTSQHDSPADELELLRDYPSYYYQVQWQIWLAEEGKGTVAWCKVPEDVNESPYDEYDQLDVNVFDVHADPDVFAVFAKNAPCFWARWCKAKAAADENDLSVLCDLGKFVRRQYAIDEAVTRLDSLEEKQDEEKQAIADKMEELGLPFYENDHISISYNSKGKTLRGRLRINLKKTETEGE